MKTAYLDNDVICGIAKTDLRAEEDAAMRWLLELQCQGRIRLAASEVAKREVAKWHGENRPDAEAVYEGLQKVKHIEGHMLIGFNNQRSTGRLVIPDDGRRSGCEGTLGPGPDANRLASSYAGDP